MDGGAGQPQQWGTTPPISMAAPTAHDLAKNEELVAELKRQGSFESAEESARRERVLSDLQKMVEKFVTAVGVQKHLTEQMARDAGGKIFTFGSFRLGVYGPGSDIDTLVVVPKHVSRDDFFNTFEPMLRERSEVTELTAVPDAHVPLIKFKYLDVSIDLLIARLALPQIKKDLELRDNNLLKNISDQCIKSLNGTRVTDQILQLVPNPAVFKHALRCIKLWAQRRAIYANIFGFPGGVAWAMLVARICQLYPKAVSAIIVSKFFRILSKWNWPQPILLKAIEDGPLQVKVWNPKIYPQDRGHRMPIITPAYPSMCATHNISASTQSIILKEMERAGEITDRILMDKASWAELFQKHTFFQNYKYYLSIVASSRSAETQLKWEGLVESKIRLLVLKLELLETIDLAHPFVKRYEQMHECETEEQVLALASGQSVPSKSNPTDVEKDANKEAKAEEEGSNGNGAESAQPESHKIWTTNWFVGVDINMRNDGSKRLDISWPTQEFYEACRKWDKYNEHDMSIALKYTRNYDLPDYVFEEGQERPQKKKSKKRRDRESSGVAADDDDDHLKKARTSQEVSA